MCVRDLATEQSKVYSDWIRSPPLGTLGAELLLSRPREHERDASLAHGPVAFLAVHVDGSPVAISFQREAFSAFQRALRVTARTQLALMHSPDARITRELVALCAGREVFGTSLSAAIRASESIWGVTVPAHESLA